MISKFVRDHGPFLPIKVFKHRTKSLKSKTNGEVEWIDPEQGHIMVINKLLKTGTEAYYPNVRKMAENEFFTWIMAL